jgi:Lar family restriction alleviation protein
MKEELKPCPFCGEVRQEFIKAFHGELYYLMCDSCAATGPGGNTKKEAAELWNKRNK